MDDTENWPIWSPYAKTYDPLLSGSIDGTDTIPHDRALIRAMDAKYVPPNKKVATPNPANTLFVGRLDHKTTDEGLKKEFERYGSITHCRVVRDVVTGFSRGYAFVQFKHHENAEFARRVAHHNVLEGREILVEWENGRTMPGWIPRRLGGGFGGKKESGQLRFGGRDRPFRKPIIIKSMRRDGPSNLDEDVVKRESFDDSGRLSTAGDNDREERRSSRMEDERLELRDSRSSNLPKGNFNKPWNRRNTDGWNHPSGRERASGQSWRDQKEWYKGDDRRYPGKSSRESDRRYSSKPSRDWMGFEERGRRSEKRKRSEDESERRDYYGGEERSYSSKSSRDSSYQRRAEKTEERSRKPQDREDASEREDPYEMEEKRYSSKSSRDSSHQRSIEKREERSRKSQDREDEPEETYQGRMKRKKRSDRLLDWEDGGESDDFVEGLVKLEGHSVGSTKDRGNVSDWKSYRSPTPEISEKKRDRSRGSLKKQDTDTREDPTENVKKRSRKSSQDRSNTEDEDDGSERKSKKKKKKKKQSKKSSRNSDSDDSYEKKKDKKKKKKHKKSRD